MKRTYIPSVKKNIVLVKLFISIVGISTIAVILVSMAIFFLFRNKTIEDIEASDRMSLINLDTMLYNTINTAENTIIETYKNPVIKRLIYENTSEWNDTMIATVNNTLSTLSTYSFMNSIYIFREANILYKASNKGIPEEQEAYLNTIIKQENPGKAVPWTFQSNSGEVSHILSIFIGERSTQTDGYESAVMVNIDMDMIYKTIFSDSLAKDQELFIVNKDGTIILHNDMNRYFTNVSHSDYIQRITKDPHDSGSFTINENGKKYNVGFIYSERGNYYVVHKIEYRLSVQKLTEARNTTLIYSFAVLILVLVLSLYMSYRIYRPIHTIFRNIRGIFADAPPASSNMDELQVMANATAKIIENMNNYDKHIENKAALELFNLSRSHVKPDEIADILKRMKLCLDPGSDYAIVVLRICNYRQFEENNTAQAIEYQLHSIGNIASEYLTGIAACSSYKINNEHAVLIASNGNKGVPFHEINVKKLMEEASDAIFHILGLEITIGISSSSDTIGDMLNKYKEAYQLTNYRLIAGKRSVIDNGIVQPEAKNDEWTPHYLAAIDAVKKASMNDFEQAVTRLFTICARLPYEIIINVCTELAMGISKIPKEIGGRSAEEKELDYYDIYVRFEKFEDFSEIRNEFKQLFQAAAATLAELNRTSVSATVSKAIQYIAEHYHDPDLAANYMADKLAISPSYFSKIFKEYTNTTFPEYVTNIRLEKAKEMLIHNPHREILEIGSQVGYNNASYFTAAFKKKFGITPSRFRANFLDMKE